MVLSAACKMSLECTISTVLILLLGPDSGVLGVVSFCLPVAGVVWCSLDNDFIDCHFHYYWVPVLGSPFWNYKNAVCYVSPNL